MPRTSRQTSARRGPLGGDVDDDQAVLGGIAQQVAGVGDDGHAIADAVQDGPDGLPGDGVDLEEEDGARGHVVSGGRARRLGRGRQDTTGPVEPGSRSSRWVREGPPPVVDSRAVSFQLRSGSSTRPAHRPAGKRGDPTGRSPAAHAPLRTHAGPPAGRRRRNASRRSSTGPPADRRRRRPDRQGRPVGPPPPGVPHRPPPRGLVLHRRLRGAGRGRRRARARPQHHRRGHAPPRHPRRASATAARVATDVEDDIDLEDADCRPPGRRRGRGRPASSSTSPRARRLRPPSTERSTTEAMAMSLNKA